MVESRPHAQSPARRGQQGPVNVDGSLAHLMVIVPEVRARCPHPPALPATLNFFCLQPAAPFQEWVGTSASPRRPAAGPESGRDTATGSEEAFSSRSPGVSRRGPNQHKMGIGWRKCKMDWNAPVPSGLRFAVVAAAFKDAVVSGLAAGVGAARRRSPEIPRDDCGPGPAGPRWGGTQSVKVSSSRVSGCGQDRAAPAGSLP